MKSYTLRAAIHDTKIFNQLRLEYRRTNKNRGKDPSSGWLSERKACFVKTKTSPQTNPINRLPAGSGNLDCHCRPAYGFRIALVIITVITTLTLFNLWAQESEAELLKQARVTKHQAKRIALAKVEHGTIKRAGLEMANGVLIWSVDVMQSGEKDLRDVWIDAKTGKITAVNVETPTFEKKEVAENKVKKWLSRGAKSP
jgi:Peptidase propeptide and YPEB domain